MAAQVQGAHVQGANVQGAGRAEMALVSAGLGPGLVAPFHGAGALGPSLSATDWGLGLPMLWP